MQKFNRKNQSGFTLIELLITVSIVAILSIISLSAYASFTNKAQVAEAFTLTEGVKHAFTAEYSTNGGDGNLGLADLDASWGSDSFSGQYVESVTLVNGTVRAQFRPLIGAPLQGTSIFMAPYETDSGVIIWRCGTALAPVDGSSVVLNVAGTMSGSPAVDPTPAATNVPASLLPTGCKA